MVARKGLQGSYPGCQEESWGNPRQQLQRLAHTITTSAVIKAPAELQGQSHFPAHPPGALAACTKHRMAGSAVASSHPASSSRGTPDAAMSAATDVGLPWSLHPHALSPAPGNQVLHAAGCQCQGSTWLTSPEGHCLATQSRM